MRVKYFPFKIVTSLLSIVNEGVWLFQKKQSYLVKSYFLGIQIPFYFYEIAEFA